MDSRENTYGFQKKCELFLFPVFVFFNFQLHKNDHRQLSILKGNLRSRILFMTFFLEIKKI